MTKKENLDFMVTTHLTQLEQHGITWTAKPDVKDALVQKLEADGIQSSVSMDDNFQYSITADREQVKDTRLKKLWYELEDVLFVEDFSSGDSMGLILHEQWQDFPAGTTRDDIHHWFDENYSGGIEALTNDVEEMEERA